MITGKSESRVLTKDISYKCRFKFDGIKYNLNQKWNNDKCWCECKKHNTREKNYIWNPDTCNCENGKHSASIIDNSAIKCDEITEETKIVPTIAVSIYCYLIKYRAKQKHLLPFHVTNNELREVLY